MAEKSSERISDRLGKRDFSTICAARPLRSTPAFRLFWASNTGGLKRLGLSVSRRVGSAVVRNRVRRRAKEIHRQNAFLLPDGTDIVLVARPGIVNLSYDELRTVLLESFEAVAATKGSSG